MSVLDEHLKRHRKRIISREELAFRELLAAYEDVRRELRLQIRALQRKIDAAVAAGDVISPSWFESERRLQTLIDQVKIEVERFGGTASRITTIEQRAAVQIAVEQAREIVMTIGGPGTLGSMLPTRAVETAVGMMGDGSPILEYYRTKLAPAVAEALRAEVIRAAATGTPFATIGKRLMAAGDITRQRALATARTEVNRVRREATRSFYQENSDIITEWEWVASSSARTCAACLVLDGRRFPLDTPFPQHINCRCNLIAVLKDVERPARTLGSEWFEAQPAAVKESVLGKDAAAAYQRGEVKLDDFLGWRNSKEFGKSVYTKPLSSVLPNKGGRPLGPITDAADRIERHLQSAGLDPGRIYAKTTNSQYITFKVDDPALADTVFKIRVSDHPPNASRTQLLDLRPDVKLSKSELLAKVNREVAAVRLQSLAAGKEFMQVQTISIRLADTNRELSRLFALKKTDPAGFADQADEVKRLLGIQSNLMRLRDLAHGNR